MAKQSDVFEFETPELVPREQLVTQTPVEFDQKKFAVELKQEEDKWANRLHEQRQSLFDQFFESKRKQGENISFIDPHNNTIKAVDYDPNLRLRNIYSQERDLNQRQKSLIREWNNFYLNKQKERFKKLSPEQKVIEVGRGGVNSQNFGLLSFIDGINDGASFGILKSNHPVYGQEYKKFFPNAHGYGRMLGGLLNFMALSKAASVLRVPEFLAKSQSLQPALSVLGAPKFYLGKIGRLKFALDSMTKLAKSGILKVPTKFLSDQALRYKTIEAAGSLGLTNGLIGMFGEGVRHTARRFKHEDQMKEKEWKRSLPRALFEGFFQKYFIGLINDPKSWAARFLGDAVYSGGQQVYRIATGQQEEFNAAEYWRSFLEGHLLGEVQGMIFQPNRQQLAAMHANNRMFSYANDLQKRFGGKVNDYWYEANELWMGELQNVYDRKSFFTPGERKAAVDAVSKVTRDGFTIRFGLKNADLMEINQKTQNKVQDQINKNIYSLADKYFGLNKTQAKEFRQADALSDPKAMVTVLKKFGKYAPTPRKEEELKPETIEGAVKNIRPMTIDKLMDNVESNFRQFFNRDVDVLDFFERPGEQLDIRKVKVVDKEIDLSVRKEEVLEQVMDWLYSKNNVNFLIKKWAGSSVTDAENLIAQAVEEMVRVPSENFETIEKPIAFFGGILRNLAKQNIRQASGKAPIKSVDEELERLTIKDFQTEERAESYNNPIYRIYDTYAKKSPASLKRFMAYYLRSIGNTMPQTQAKLNAMGIKIKTRNALRLLIQHGKNDLEKIVLNREAVRAVPIRKGFTRKETAEIRQRIEEEGADINPLTGAKARITPSINNRIKNEGGYVVSLTSLYNEVLRQFGDKIAKKVIFKAHQVLNNEVQDINRLIGRKGSGLDVVNPIDNQSTKFVVFQRGLEDQEFRDSIQQINKIMKQNYDDISEADKRFAVTIKKADDTGDVISDFDNISFTRFNSFENIFNDSNKIESLKDLSRILEPLANDILNRGYYDSNNTKLKSGLKNIEKIIDLKPKSDDEWVDILRQMDQESPEKIENLKNNLVDFVRDMDTFTLEVAPITRVSRENQQDFSKARRADLQRVAENDVVINRQKIIDDIAERDIKDMFMIDIHKAGDALKAEASDMKNSIGQLLKDKLTVLGNLEQKGEGAQRAIILLNKLADTVNRSDYKTSDLLQAVFQDFHADIIAGGGKAGQRAMMAYDNLGQWQRELELKNIVEVNKDTGELKLSINPNKLKEPIKMRKKTEDTQASLESLKDRPQDFNPEFINLVFKDSQDPLVFSKILVQNYGIEPQRLIDIASRLEQDWYQPLANWTVKAGDKNFSYFENMKSNLEKAIRNSIRINVGLLKAAPGKPAHNIDKVDFEADGQKAVEAFVREIKDLDRRDRVLKAVDWFYHLDPDKLSYVHHTVLGDNSRKFRNMITDFINGDAPRGTKVADPFFETLLAQRKMPRLPDLVDAGYRVDPSYFNILNGTMRYAFTKRSNELIAQEWKNTYMRDFSKAFDAARIQKTPGLLIEWFRENSGYFYLPAKSEIGLLNKKVTEINERLNVIEDKTDPIFVKLQRQRADITERLDLMNLLRKTFSSSRMKEEIANAVLGKELFIPGNFNSFILDRGSKNLDSILSGVKTQVDDMRSANITNYDGLYFNSSLWKGMRNLVFRNDGMPRNSKYSVINKARNFYDKTNRFMKMIRFYKPTIIMANDLIQSAFANPMFVKNLPWAFRAYRNPNAKTPDGKLTKDAQIVRDAQKMNLFNKSVSMEPLLSESARDVGAIMGRPGIFGKIAADMGVEKNFFRKMGVGMKDFWRAQQQVTWDIDGVIRLATYRSMYDKFSKVYDPERAKFMAAEWTNLFLVKYSRIPASTRRSLNRVGFVLTYRIQTLRMYKEMMKMAGRSVKRRLGIPVETPMFKVSDDVKKQAQFEMAPLLRSLMMKTAVKVLLFNLFGFGYNNWFDAISGYRAKRKKGDGVIDSEMQFVSLGTPLFDIEKHITRLSRAPMVWLKYNMAAFPGLIYSLATNEDMVTGERIVTVPWAKKPRKATAQLGANLLLNYTPWARDVKNLAAKDANIIAGLISNFGLGYYYNWKSPKTLLAAFKAAADTSRSPADHARALKRFHFDLKRAYKVLFDKQFKDMADRLDEANDALEEQRIRT